MKLVIELSETYPTNIQRAIANGKPLITCQECGKWKDTCMRIVFDKETDDYVFTDPDDFCKDGTPKEAK